MQRVKIVVIGAGNRTNKYMEYAKRHPERLELVSVVEPVEIRRRNMAERFGLKMEDCYASIDDFFAAKVDADAVLIGTPEDKHFEPTMRSIDAGYHVLLEKPIAQTKEECLAIQQNAHRQGVVVGVCHVLRFHPYFMKIKEVVDSGALGEIISINHYAEINIDRMTHSYVRGLWSQSKKTNPMLIAKCCHDIDFLLWVAGSKCRRVSSFGSLRWFREERAPEGSAKRCIDCRVEKQCPYSAVNLYKEHKEWIRNFDVPEGRTIDDVIDEELRSGRFGRCVHHCDNDVVDNQILNMELENGTLISFVVNAFTRNDFRGTHIKLTHGEIDGNETTLRVRRFRDNEEQVFDFSGLCSQPFHAGADLNIVEEFVNSITRSANGILSSTIDSSIESHVVCYEAETSRLTGQTIEIK
ncbi:MAG: Gfo/Idh/MocA family oxidoreductase [Alistipes sp.]|nr:Gfo/Idh/MocA family oxidoreductase [Alistipes sp.]